MQLATLSSFVEFAFAFASSARVLFIHLPVAEKCAWKTHTHTHARTHTRRLPYASGLRPPRHNKGRARGRSFGPRDYMYIAVFAQTPCPRRGTNLHFCLYLASHVFSQFAQVYELRRILSIGHYCVVEWNDDPFGWVGCIHVTCQLKFVGIYTRYFLGFSGDTTVKVPIAPTV